MVTETSSLGGLAARETWMDGTINGVFSLREQGVPVVGYTWFPLFTMIDWAYRTRAQAAEQVPDPPGTVRRGL